MIKKANSLRRNLTQNYLFKKYFRDKMTLDQIAAETGRSSANVAYWMSKYGLARRSPSEATYNYFNKEECFKISSLTQGQKLLKNIALILYWCEGTNKRIGTKTPSTLAFTNTEVEMLKIWLKFLNVVCNLRSNKIKARLYLHKNQNGKNLIKYWSEALRIPINQFENVSYSKKNSTQKEYKGTVKIKVHNVKLYQLIQDWIKELRLKVLAERF